MKEATWMSTTWRADCYNRILKEFPQLTPYAHETPYEFHIGIERDELYMSAIVISEYGLVACWEPAQSERFIMRSTDDLDYIISNLRPHIDEMLRTLQDFDKIADPERDFNILDGLGLECEDDGSSLQWILLVKGKHKRDDREIVIESPYYPRTASQFSWILTVEKAVTWDHGRDLVLSTNYFNTLDSLLDYLANGGV